MMSRTDQAPITPGLTRSAWDSPAYDSVKSFHAEASFSSTCRRVMWQEGYFASWKMMPSVCRWPERSRLTP